VGHKVHLVDGTFELFRCFHAAPRVRAPSGREVGAARGLLQTLLRLVRKEGATHLAIAYDSVAPGRPGQVGDDAALRGQFPLAADVTRALGMALWPMVRFQADDALATAAQRYTDHPAVDQIVICSTDRDFAQCVRGARVVLFDRIRKRLTDEHGVRERFGVAPTQIPELFALVGDPSDGLPGIPGWGQKSAATVLGRYPRIEEIPADAATWDVEVRGAARLGKSLEARRSEALLYRNLSILRTDVPLVDTVEDIEWRGADRAALGALLERIGDDGVLERVPRWRE